MTSIEQVSFFIELLPSGIVAATINLFHEARQRHQRQALDVYSSVSLTNSPLKTTVAITLRRSQHCQLPSKE
jgi:hypothetical protein